MLRRIPIYIATLPVDLFGWGLVLLIHVLWGQNLEWRDGVLSTEIRPGTWPVRVGRWPTGWYLYDRARGWPWGGTTIGHAMWHGRPGLRAAKTDPLTPHQVHEFHHVRQSEAAQIAAFLNALAVLIVCSAAGSPWLGFWLALWIWCLGGSLAVSGGGWLAAWIRGDSRGFYRGSAHEVGAYAVGDLAKIQPGVEP